VCLCVCSCFVCGTAAVQQSSPLSLWQLDRYVGLYTTHTTTITSYRYVGLFSTHTITTTSYKCVVCSPLILLLIIVIIIIIVTSYSYHSLTKQHQNVWKIIWYSLCRRRILPGMVEVN